MDTDPVIFPHREIAVLLTIFTIGCSSGTEPQPVASLSVEPAVDTVAVGDRTQFRVIARDADGEVISGISAEWGVTDSTKASILDGGLTAQAPGEVRVIARFGDLTADAAVLLPRPFETLNAGVFYRCGVSVEGTFCWGNNRWGQLGNGEAENNSFGPQRVDTQVDFAAVAAGASATCALDSTGRAYCWGLNEVGQVGDGTTTDRLRPVSVAGDHRFVEISAGGFPSQHNCARTAQDEVFCWGNNNGAFGTSGSSEDSSVPVRAADGLTLVTVTSGKGGGCGITPDNEGLCWGSNIYGQAGHGTLGISYDAPREVAGGHLFERISQGGGHTCAVTTQGAGLCWGWNRSGQLGNGEEGIDLEEPEPVVVMGGLEFSEIQAGGNDFSCGVTTDQRTFCWGYQWGPQPVAVSGPPVSGLSAGEGRACAVSEDGLGYCWSRGAGQMQLMLGEDQG